MRIVNKTKYQTADLRAFVYWVARREGLESSYTKRLRVRVFPSRSWHTGTAPLASYSITIRIPGPDRLDKPRLASLIAHEMMHNHQTGDTFKPYSTERWMRGSGRYSGRNGSPEKYWADAKEFPLRLVEPKPKKKPTPRDRAETGRAKAAKKVEEWQRRLRRTNNALKK